MPNFYGSSWCLFVFVSGDDITVYGVVMQRWKPFHQDSRCDVEIVLKANYIQVNNEQIIGITIDEDVRKEFKDFWERHKNDPLAGLQKILKNGINSLLLKCTNFILHNQIVFPAL